MPVNLSIKNVPDELAAGLRARAARHHRSIQGELMAILEEAVGSDHRLSASEVLARVRALRLTTTEEAAQTIRTDRDGR
jgi:plasmid stability protein